MELEAKVIQVLPEISGVSQAGNSWKKKEWIVETVSNYPKKVKIEAFGDRSDQFSFEFGKTYKFQVDIESREYNGRWFTNVSVFSAQEAAPSYPQGMPQQGGYPQGGAPFNQPAVQQPAAPFSPQGDESDDLPF